MENKTLMARKPNLDGKRLERLYKMIPAVPCKPGCHDCCGPVAWSRREWEGCPDKRTAASLACPYIEPGKGCAVYAHRPLICRLFGATVDRGLACPHGCAPPLPLSQRQTDEIMGEYLEILARELEGANA